MLHAIETSRLILEQKMIKICLETNGNLNSTLLRKFAKLSLKSGGIIKFDLKFWSENLNYALCGTSNKKSYENFEMLVEIYGKRARDHLHASTLLIPGYVNEFEIEGISRFLANLDPSIPYSLLGFYPAYEFRDVGFLSLKKAMEFKEIALNQGLERVRLGNLHLFK
jgi:pyruvate formate lyase activating enzyme